MGSKLIEDLEYRQGFVFIGSIGKNVAHEKSSDSIVSVTKVFIIHPCKKDNLLTAPLKMPKVDKK